MEKETLKSIFNFIEEKEARKTPFLWKVLNDEPLTEDDLHIKGNLDLGFTKIISLPRGLKVEGFIDLNGTKLTEYSDDELRKMVKPGYIKGRIFKV
jgi:hypothetical protein